MDDEIDKPLFLQKLAALEPFGQFHLDRVPNGARPGEADEGLGFAEDEIAQHRDYSEATAIKIDEQVRKLVEGGYDRARRIIEERAEALKRIAEALLEREVLDGDEVNALIAGDTLPDKPAAGGPEPPALPVVRPEPPKGGLPGLLGGERPQPA